MWTDDEHATDVSHDSDNDANHATAGIVDDPEVWMDYWSEELLDLWHSLKDQCTSRGLAILETGRFPDFAQFCFRFSSGYPPVA